MKQDRIETWSALTLFGRRWYWRAVAANGESVAIGGEGYNSPAARDHGLIAASRILGGSKSGVPIMELSR